ncbi:MAG: multiheme c-type cytochrome, partial [Planctomycetota bacterium]
MSGPEPNHSPRHPPYILLTVVVTSLVLAGGVLADYWNALPADAEATFVGRESCIDCHPGESQSFAGSHHDLAMDVATDETVLGDFDDATIEHDGIVSRLFRDGDRFMVRTEGETGEMEDFEIKYVFGVDPLQQYMVEFDRPKDLPSDQIARLQVLRISWDTHAKRWFYLRPPDVDDKLEPDDPLHWTGIAQRWQTMCADCHSTDLRRNFDVATQQYHTTFSEIDVSCEACHGPGSLHLELANRRSLFWDRNHGYGLAKLKGKDPTAQLESCAPCHSRRGVMQEGFQPGQDYCNFFQLENLREETYHRDGQIKDEVYVYGSFVQSKMYHQGIRCTDCHDPHTAQLKHEGNAVCTSCHQHAAGKYDVPSHHHHAVGTEAAQCVNCHMPHTTYMDVDARRDHSLRVPRPDLSVKLGTPNACSGCHVTDQLDSLKQSVAPEVLETLVDYADWQLAAEDNAAIADAIMTTDQWCDDACEKWYGEQRKQPAHFAEALAAFRDGEASADDRMLRLILTPEPFTPSLARATALAEFGASGTPKSHVAAAKILESPEEPAELRAAAAQAMSTA